MIMERSVGQFRECSTLLNHDLPRRFAALALLLSVVSGCGDAATPSPTATAATATPSDATAIGTDESLGEDAVAGTASAVHLKLGETGRTGDIETAADVTVSDAKIIKAPEDWGDPKIVIATVTTDVVQGQYTYDERGFTLVQADGTRLDANGVASDYGLPGAALGSGTLTAPDKAKGLVTFSPAPKSLTGLKIQLRTDPDGRDWSIS